LITAQEAISAHIIDAETLKPIDLVSVVSSVSGTITNREGGFIVRTDANDYLQISHLSYYPQNISTSQLSDTIFLQPRIVELAEFIIMPREAIIRELTAVWEKYYNLLRRKRERDSPVQTFYYRQLTQNNNVYVEYIEAFFTAPTSVRVETLFLQEGRFGVINTDSTNVLTNYFRVSQARPFHLENAKTKNAVNSFLVRDFEKYYDVSITQIIAPNSTDETVVYQFTPYREMISENAVMLSGQLYVRTRDRAIVRMRASTPFLTGRSGTLNITNEICSFTITYRDGIESYPIVESVSSEMVIAHLRNGQSHQLRVNSTLYAVDQLIETRRRTRTMRKNDFLLKRIHQSGHNQEFWNNNPFIKRTKVEQQVLDDFNRLGYFGSMNLSE
jgi:hypothetical protein